MANTETRPNGPEKRKLTLTDEEMGNLEHCLSYLTGFFQLLEPEKYFDAGLTALFSEATEKVAEIRHTIGKTF